MGTETSNQYIQGCFQYEYFVKLNNPLMGTETHYLAFNSLTSLVKLN